MAVKSTAYLFLFCSFKQTEQPSASRHIPVQRVFVSVYLSLQLLLLTSEYLWELEGVTANCPIHKREGRTLLLRDRAKERPSQILQSSHSLNRLIDYPGKDKVIIIISTYPQWESEVALMVKCAKREFNLPKLKYFFIFFYSHLSLLMFS